MPQQTINIGTSANDKTGTPLRTAFNIINQNFTEIYGKTAAGANFDLTGNTITSTNTNGDIILDPNGTGVLSFAVNAVQITTSKTPPNARGSAGDRIGMVAWDAAYLYVCTANYDGSTNIWRRSATASW